MKRKGRKIFLPFKLFLPLCTKLSVLQLTEVLQDFFFTFRTEFA